MPNDDSTDVRDALVFSRRIFSLGGLWPDKYMPLIPETLVVYIAFHLVTEIWALVELPDRTAIALIMCSLEFVFMFTMFLLFILIRFNNHLKPLIDNMRREMEEEKIFKNNTEKHLYLRYNAISYNFGKYSLMLQCGLVSLIFFRPLIHLLGRSFAVRRWSLRSAVPLGNSYLVHAVGAHSGSQFDSYIEPTPMREILDFVLPHTNRASQTGRSFSREHQEPGATTFEADDNLRTDSVAAINFTMYAVNLAALLYLYSYVGEQFVYESEDLAAALYDTEWPEVMNKDRRTLLTCLVNGQRTEYLTAGKFYKFSLFGFTDMMKFSMGFISMLQARME
ncbi:uncharacterized protein LOC116429751 isoform X2 [Nomia melanderi]|uniref:uncharacterized protein LOC116429751 isoform X2 n=1 Tax=Nomia melanderi TaxID=2448451 RepID=UPI003FCE0DC5